MLNLTFHSTEINEDETFTRLYEISSQILFIYWFACGWAPEDKFKVLKFIKSCNNLVILFTDVNLIDPTSFSQDFDEANWILHGKFHFKMRKSNEQKTICMYQTISSESKNFTCNTEILIPSKEEKVKELDIKLKALKANRYLRRHPPERFSPSFIQQSTKPKHHVDHKRIDSNQEIQKLKDQVSPLIQDIESLNKSQMKKILLQIQRILA
jgi:hypothetical protein